MTDFDIHAAMATLREEMPRYQQPLIEAMGGAQQTPFHILIATILSLRTKDTLTAVVAPRLFAVADTPAEYVPPQGGKCGAVLLWTKR